MYLGCGFQWLIPVDLGKSTPAGSLLVRIVSGMSLVARLLLLGGYISVTFAYLEISKMFSSDLL